MVSRNFKRSEFACKCGCGFDTVDIELIKILERIRQHFKFPVIINSGCRCQAHNIVNHGSRSSQHCLGRAADFTVKCTDPIDIYTYLNTKEVDWQGGLGLYDNFIHIDSRNKKVRWKNQP